MPQEPQIAADLSLVAGVLAGRSDAVQKLFGQVDALVRLQTRRNFPDAERDDLLSDFRDHLWANDWRRLRQWRAEAPLGHYLATLFRNFQNDALRAIAARRRAESGAAIDPVLAAPLLVDGPERAHEAVQLAECLEHGKAAITPRQRQILVLRHDEHLPYGEIATRMAVTIGTVGSNLADAEKALRRRLQGECKELLEHVLGTGVRVH